MRQLLFVFVFFVVFCVTPVWAETQGADTEFTAAVIKEQNVTFAVVFVKNSVLDDKKTADSVIEILEPSFGGIPVILMVQDSAGRSSYYGRQDIVEFLANTPIESMPWKKYALKQVEMQSNPPPTGGEGGR